MPEIKLKFRNADLKVRLLHVTLVILDGANDVVTQAGRVLWRSRNHPPEQSNHNSEVRWGLHFNKPSVPKKRSFLSCLTTLMEKVFHLLQEQTMIMTFLRWWLPGVTSSSLFRGFHDGLYVQFIKGNQAIAASSNGSNALSQWATSSPVCCGARLEAGMSAITLSAREK